MADQAEQPLYIPKKETKPMVLTNEQKQQVHAITMNIDSVPEDIRKMAMTRNDVISTLENGHPLNRLMTDEDGAVIGYIACADQEHLNEYEQQALSLKPGTAYIKYFGTEQLEDSSPQRSKYKFLKRELDTFFAAAEGLGYRKLAFHGFNKKLNRRMERYGFTVKRSDFAPLYEKDLEQKQKDDGTTSLVQKFPPTKDRAIAHAGKLTPQQVQEYYGLARKPKAQKTPEDVQTIKQLESAFMSEWFTKLESHFIDTDGTFDHVFFTKWEQLFSATHPKKAILIQQLTDGSYSEICAERAVRGEDSITKNAALIQRRTEQLDQLINTEHGWFPYVLTGQGATQFPEKWFRYYILHEVITHNRNGKTRTADTAMHFIDLHTAALQQVYEQLKILVTPQPGEDAKARQSRLEQFQQYDFHHRYNQYINETREEQWYDQWVVFDNPEKLAAASAGTPWCLATLETARSYLQTPEDHIHVYFDTLGQPRIGVYTKENEVREVRGVDDNQQLDPSLTEILDEKLGTDEFENTTQWKQQTADVRRLGRIEAAVQINEEPSQDDLIFLYQVQRPIQTFGYGLDVRIINLWNLRKQQNKQEQDILTIFGTDAIARTPDEITPATKAYIGKLVDDKNKPIPGIFQKIQSLEYVYTSFPEGRKKTWHGLSLSKLSPQQEITDLEDTTHHPRIRVWDGAKTMMNRSEYVQGNAAYRAEQGISDESDTYIELSLEDLGITTTATWQDIEEKAKEFGLEKCPPGIAPVLRAVYKNQPVDSWSSIYMDPIPASYGYPSVFRLFHIGDELGLSYSRTGIQWNPNYHLVVRIRKLET